MIDFYGMSTGQGLFYGQGPIEFESFIIYLTYRCTLATGQSGFGSNGIERVHHTTHISRTGSSSTVQCHTQDSLFFGGGSYPSAGDTVILV